MAQDNAATPETSSLIQNPTLTPASVANDIEQLHDKYHAFVRRDTYGTLGVGPLSLPAKLHLWVASFTLLPVRAILCLALLSLFYLTCLLATLFHRPVKVNNQVVTYANLKGARRWLMTFFGRIIARAILFVIGFHVIQERSIPAAAETGAESEHGGAGGGWASCVVSSHVSWVDILYHTYAHPRGLPSFVAKKSVATMPMAGFMSRCLGCIYVDRGETGAARSESGVAGVIAQRLRASQADPSEPLVLLFPEGTTSNGTSLLPFRTGAFVAGTPVEPVLLRYGGPLLSPAWDAIGGVRHVVLMLCQPWHTLEVTRLPVYAPSAAEQRDPKLYAENVRARMAAQGGLGLSMLTFHDKLVYAALLEGKPTPQPPRSKSD